jgi:hypothetical protein
MGHRGSDADALTYLFYCRLFDDSLFIIMVNTAQVPTFSIVSLNNELWDLLQRVIELGDEVLLLHNGKCIEYFLKLMWFKEMNNSWKLRLIFEHSLSNRMLTRGSKFGDFLIDKDVWVDDTKEDSVIIFETQEYFKVQFGDGVLQEGGAVWFAQKFVLVNVTFSFYSYLKKIMMGCFDVEAVVLAGIVILLNGKGAVGITDVSELFG